MKPNIGSDAYKRHLLTKAQVDSLKPIVDELSPKLNAYIKSIKARPEETPTINEQRTTNREQ